MKSVNNGKSNDSEQIQKLRRSFLLYVFACFLVYSTYGTLLNLQSSINIVDGLGALSVATTYSVAVFFSLTFSPMIIRRFGPKRSLCAAECAHVIYIAANIRPNFYTMIPASILLGMGDSMFWNCLPLMNANFAKAYWRARGRRSIEDKDEKYYITTFSGLFFTIFQINKTFGNLISYLALYAFSEKLSGTQTIENNATGFINVTQSPSLPMIITDTADEYHFCGANDCQDATVVKDSLQQYQPSPLAASVLIGILFTTCFVAVMIHIFLIPNISDTGECPAASISCALGRKRANSVEELCEEDPISIKDQRSMDAANASPHGSLTLSNSRSDFQVQDGQLGNKDSLIIKTDDNNNSSQLKDAGTLRNKEIRRGGGPQIFGVFRQLLNLKQICLAPLILYCGLHLGFAFSEMTRAYSSCVVGVSWVPIHVAVYGAGNVFISYVIGKFSKRIGICGFLCIAALLDVACYSYDAVWIPSPHTAWSLFIVYFAFGISQGIWVSQTMVMQVLYFPKRPEVACGLWSALFAAGLTIQFGWSTSVCLRQKIFIHLGLLVFCALSYEMARRIRAKEKNKLQNFSESYRISLT